MHKGTILSTITLRLTNTRVSIVALLIVQSRPWLLFFRELFYSSTKSMQFCNSWSHVQNFLVSVFWWLRIFCDKIIFGSASKAFTSWMIWIFVRQSTSITIFLFLFSDLFKTFFHRMVRKSTMCALFLGRVCFFIVFTRSWLTAVKIKIFCL